MYKNKEVLITGGAGFIGSQLADYLLAKGHRVTVVDNLSWGKMEFIEHNLINPYYRFIKIDLLDANGLKQVFPDKIDTVFHLAANSDISRSAKDPVIDLNNTTLATFNLLETMRVSGAKKIFYFSGSGVYGDVGGVFTKESFGPLCPVSMYGATKLSAEAMIYAYSNLFDFQSWVLRPANIIGPRATHGVIFDFIKKLKNRSQKLVVLGDGKQSKSYIYVSDVLEAVDLVWNQASKAINIFNISSNSFVTVEEIAKIVTGEMRLNTEIEYTGGNIGWRGDVSIVRISSEKIEKLGWKSSYTSEEAVRKTVRKILGKE